MRIHFLTAVVLSLGCAAIAQDRRDAPFIARQEQYLQQHAARRLKQGPNPRTWVDVERWCVAHACLTTGQRLDEANQYLDPPYRSGWTL